jgi:hemerythrin-like domain-containing protein
MKCTDLLTQEHKTILRGLDILDHMAARIEEDQPIAVEDVETILRFLRAFADNQHQAKEESALFPELLRTSAANDAALRQMIFEHDQERSLVEGLEDSLRTKRGMEFVHFANRLTGLIRTHIRKEDNILFPMAERCLSPEQDERVTTELNKFEVDVAFLADLRRLEWTYLRRVA